MSRKSVHVGQGDNMNRYAKYNFSYQPDKSFPTFPLIFQYPGFLLINASTFSYFENKRSYEK